MEGIQLLKQKIQSTCYDIQWDIADMEDALLEAIKFHDVLLKKSTDSVRTHFTHPRLLIYISQMWNIVWIMLLIFLPENFI